MVKVEGLVKGFTSDKERVAAVHHVSFEVPEGRLFTLLGPSGCGKTTTLRCVAGLERPDSGEVTIGDSVVFSSERRLFVPPFRRAIGMVFQNYAIWPHMTVFDNVAFPLVVERRPRGEIRSRVLEALKVVGLSGLEDRLAPRLSGGQQQRVALARALVKEPRVLLLDEPLSNLDAKLRAEMRVEIRELQQRLGITALYVTHDQAEALALSDLMAVLRGGAILQIGTPEEIYLRPQTQFVAEFIGAANFLTGRVLSLKESDGFGRIETPHGVIASLIAPTLRSGDPVKLAIHPERMVIHSTPPADMKNCLSGLVRTAAFMGAVFECQIQIGEETWRAQAPLSLPIKAGESVTLWVNPEGAVAVPLEQST